MLNKPKKYLGQNFLKNKKILEEMARAAEISKKDVVLEVGPGKGSLTEILSARAKKVIAVEKDRDLIPILHKKFSALDEKNVEIICGDILKLNPKSLKLKNYKIVANIPYYITSYFLRKFLEAKNKPDLMVLMIQKEVADRILAKDKKESLLSLSVKAYAKPEIIRNVSKNFFSPPPKVDSAIIKICVRNAVKPPLGGLTAKFWEILRAAFQQKRKMLRHSIGKKIALPEKYQNLRPENLTLKDWKRLTIPDRQSSIK